MCTDKPLVSVIVPTFNRAHLICDTINSVLEQTYTHFEILVVDDGSTDDTEHVVRRFQDSRVTYFKEMHSGLPAPPRNVGIQNAKGKYIAFLDSDDLWLPDKLMMQTAFLEQNPDVGLLYTQCVGFFEARTDVTDPIPEGHLAKSGWIYSHLILSDNYIPCLTVMIRRKILKQTGIFNESDTLRAVEDFDLWLRIARLYPVGFLPVVLARYRSHAQGISSATIKLLENRLHLLNGHERAGYVEQKKLKSVRFVIYLRLALAYQKLVNLKKSLNNLGLAFVHCPSFLLLVKTLWPFVNLRLKKIRSLLQK